MNRIEKAVQIAIAAHEGQTRKHDGSPYIVHPVSVALILTRYGFDEIVVSAGVTHDVLEDTECTEKELNDVLGKEVVEIVKTLSEDKTLSWEERKERYRNVVQKGSEAVKAVAVADKLHNLDNLLEAYQLQGEQLWKQFTRGKEKQQENHRLFLEMLEASWQHPLLEEYRKRVERMLAL